MFTSIVTEGNNQASLFLVVFFSDLHLRTRGILRKNSHKREKKQKRNAKIGATQFIIAFAFLSVDAFFRDELILLHLSAHIYNHQDSTKSERT